MAKANSELSSAPLSFAQRVNIRVKDILDYADVGKISEAKHRWDEAEIAEESMEEIGGLLADLLDWAVESAESAEHLQSDDRADTEVEVWKPGHDLAESAAFDWVAKRLLTCLNLRDGGAGKGGVYMIGGVEQPKRITGDSIIQSLLYAKAATITGTWDIDGKEAVCRVKVSPYAADKSFDIEGWEYSCQRPKADVTGYVRYYLRNEKKAQRDTTSRWF